MRRLTVLAAVVLVCHTIFAAGGCGTGCWPARDESAARGASRQSGVAVVDLDEVAKQLGSDATLLKAIADGEASLNQQLKVLQSSLQEKFRRKSQELEAQTVGNGVTSEARKQQLAQIEQELNRQLAQAQRSAQVELTSYQKRLLQSFRDEVIPAAQEAAGERGLGVVLTKNDAVLLAFDDAHNITEAVVAKLRARRATAATTNSPATAPRR